MSVRLYLVACIWLTALIVGCASASAAGAPVAPSTVLASPSPTAVPNTEIANWREDLKFLADQLSTRHPNPFYRTPQAEFERAVNALDAAIPNLSRDEIVAGFIRVAAMIDGHTLMPFWQNGVDFHLYPIRLYEFSDGIFVIDAAASYRDLIGARLVKIGDTPIEEAYPRVSAFAMHDNASTVKLLTPVFMVIAEVLRAQGLIEELDTPHFGFVTRDGKSIVSDLQPVATGTYLTDLPGTFYSGLPKRDAPLMLQKRDRAFWYAVLPESNTLYVQYNQVRATTAEGSSLIAFADELTRLVGEQDFGRIVVDVRHNGGGDNHTYFPLLNFLKDNPRVNQPGKLFLITGRQTFSAAANFSTEVERKTNALFAGEPMGGSPNLYGDTRTYTLPHSRLQVLVSARTWIKSRADDPRLSIEPQVPAELSSQDYFSGRDPVLEAIVAYKPASDPVPVKPRTVTFPTGDGATLHGTLYGSSATAIVFSNMGANKQDTWTGMAERAAQQGYMALTYDNRYWVTETRIQDNLRAFAPDDLRAAVSFLREQGAERIVLAGASLGSMASAKVAADTNPAAVILMASPIDRTGLPFLVTGDDIRAIASPKLFLVAENDVNGFTPDVRKMYDMGRAPRDQMIFGGTAHGTDVFRTPEGEAVMNKIIAFLEAQVPLPYSGVRVALDAQNVPMVYVPRGSFVMGSDALSATVECEKWLDKTQCAGDWYVPETPTHTVMLDAFWIDRTEVTNAQYAECVAAGECTVPAKTGSPTRSSYYADPAFSEYPVVWVSWEDARTFCTWRGARLPTEAEWEKAARSGDARLYPWGNEFAPDKMPNGNFCDANCSRAGANSSLDDGFPDTSPVGKYPQGASLYGAMDMAGNVDEWVNDWYLPSYYGFSPRENPQGPAPTKQHVTRGGSFHTPAFGLRTTARSAVKERGDTTGFRCAASDIP